MADNPIIEVTFRLGPTIVVPFQTPVAVGIPLPAGTAEGDVLVWNAALGRWEARQIAVITPTLPDHVDSIVLRNLDTGSAITITAADAADPLKRRLIFDVGGTGAQDAIYLKNGTTGADVRMTLRGPDSAPYPEFLTATGTPRWDALYLRDGSLYVELTCIGPDDSPTYQLDQE